MFELHLIIYWNLNMIIIVQSHLQLTNIYLCIVFFFRMTFRIWTAKRNKETGYKNTLLIRLKHITKKEGGVKCHACTFEKIFQYYINMIKTSISVLIGTTDNDD